jgi:hypothetical protein
MQWVQTRYVEERYEKLFRFKCNGCGITQELPFGGTLGVVPNGWRLGFHEGWHFCPSCEKPKRGTALPVL